MKVESGQKVDLTKSCTHVLTLIYFAAEWAKGRTLNFRILFLKLNQIMLVLPALHVNMSSKAAYIRTGITTEEIVLASASDSEDEPIGWHTTICSNKPKQQPMTNFDQQQQQQQQP